MIHLLQNSCLYILFFLHFLYWQRPQFSFGQKPGVFLFQPSEFVRVKLCHSLILMSTWGSVPFDETTSYFGIYIPLTLLIFMSCFRRKQTNLYLIFLFRCFWWQFCRLIAGESCARSLTGSRDRWLHFIGDRLSFLQGRLRKNQRETKDKMYTLKGGVDHSHHISSECFDKKILCSIEKMNIWY